MNEQSKIIRLKRKYKAGYIAKIKIIHEEKTEVRIFSSGTHRYTFYPQEIIYNPQRQSTKGNSIVYDNGEDFQTGNKCTFKQIPVRFQPELKYVTRQIETYQILMKQKHPNLIQVIEIFFIDIIDTVMTPQEYEIAKLMQCSFYFVMKKQNQCTVTLSNYIGKKMCQQQILKIILQIVEGLCFLHKENNKYVIAHRDLKPQNILVHEVNKEVKIRIIDFGLSRVMCKNLEGETLSRQQKLTYGIGSKCYMPPQIIIKKQKNTYNQKCDLWSLGAICYKIITQNQLMVRQENEGIQDFAAKFKKLEIQKKVASVTKLTPIYKRTWQQILYGCLKLDPNKRLTPLQIRTIIRQALLKDNNQFPILQNITKRRPFHEKPTQTNDLMQIIQFDIMRIETIINVIRRNKQTPKITSQMQTEIINLCLLSIQRICIILYEFIKDYNKIKFDQLIDKTFIKGGVSPKQYMNMVLNLKIQLKIEFKCHSEFNYMDYSQVVNKQQNILQNIQVLLTAQKSQVTEMEYESTKQ